MTFREQVDQIVTAAIQAVLPDRAVERALTELPPEVPVTVIAVGKAAWQMAHAAACVLQDRVKTGVVITKYGHSQGEIPDMTIYEAGHPVPDENSVLATEAAISVAERLGADDQLLFLLSGGGSALFEKPLVPLEELADITGQLLRCGADIQEINTVRKRLSAVKGGRFAQLCAPTRVFSVILSDVLGDRMDMIASGPTAEDATTAAEACAIAEKYSLVLTDEARALLCQETAHSLSNVTNRVTGSVRQLCEAVRQQTEDMGYTTTVLTDGLCCNAADVGSFLAAIGRTYADTETPRAFVAGGETVVRVTGTGLGGRNQELVLSAAMGIEGLNNVAVFSVGSDGTDGPTDAAGGYADGRTVESMRKAGVCPADALRNNDSYHALKAVNGLIVTGATGTNVNDVCAVLIEPRGKSEK